MEEHYISAFIDDQLDLDEKIQFVHGVHGDPAFKEETLAYLHQEQQLRAPAVNRLPRAVPFHRRSPWPWGWFKQLGFYGGGLATALLVIFMIQIRTPAAVEPIAHRFVIYQPDIQAAALVGDFNHWETLTMTPSGASGYWEITVALPPGEYHYSFLLDGLHQVPDPTSTMRERDDFGSVNSILTIQSPISV